MAGYTPTLLQQQNKAPIDVYPVNWIFTPQTPMALAMSRLPWNFIIGGALVVSALLLVAEKKR